MARAKTSKVKKVTFSSRAAKTGSKDPVKVADRELKKRKKAAAKAKEKEQKRIRKETQTFIIRQAKKYAFKRKGKTGELLHPSTVVDVNGKTRIGGWGGYAGQDWEGRIILNETEVDYIINKAYTIIADAYRELSVGGSAYETWLATGRGGPDYIYRKRHINIPKMTEKLNSSIDHYGKYNVALRIEKAAEDFFKRERLYLLHYDEDVVSAESWLIILQILDTAITDESIAGVEMKKRVKIRRAGQMGEFNLAEAEEIGFIGTDVW